MRPPRAVKALDEASELLEALPGDRPGLRLPPTPDAIELEFVARAREVHLATDAVSLRAALIRMTAFAAWWASRLDDEREPSGVPQ